MKVKTKKEFFEYLDEMRRNVSRARVSSKILEKEIKKAISYVKKKKISEGY